MAVSGTLGALLQGVSQQPPAIRNDGQVTAQDNMISDVVKGLTSRPASNLLGTNATADEDMDWHTVTISGNKYHIGFAVGEFRVIDAEGVDYPRSRGGNSAYIGNNMGVHVYNDTLYVYNRDKVVAMDPSTAAAEANVVRNRAYLTVGGGEFSHTYTVTVVYANGDTATGSYTTPDGTNAGDAADSTGEEIAKQLNISLQAHANFGSNTTVARKGSVLQINCTGETGDTTVTATDGSGGNVIKVQMNYADDITDLSKYAANGALTRVAGGDGGEDDIWLRFQTEATFSVGGGFNKAGAWYEHFDVSQPSSFDLSTMPHKITDIGGILTLEQGDWLGRRVGDASTNPEPSFVGKTIRDMNGFQSRLVLISGPNLITSQTNDELDFWRTTVTAELPVDAIDIKSTAETEFEMQWIVPFDRDLILFADASQFILTGATALTPSNASLVQTTNFEMGNAARPASTGKTLMFPFSSGGFAGVKEFYSTAEGSASDAEAITTTADEYMSGKVKRLVASTNFEFLIVQTDDAAESKTLYVYQYYFENNEKVQASWSRWTFPFDVENVFFDGSTMNLLMHDPDELGFHVVTLDMDLPDNVETGYPVVMDSIATDTAETDLSDAQARTRVVLPWPNAKIVQGTGCAVPGQTALDEIVDNGDGTYDYYFLNATVPDGATVLTGLPVTASVKPTMPFIRDGNGAAIKNTKLVVTQFVLYYEESGYINATMSSKYRTTDREMSNEQAVVANDPDDPDGLGIRSGSYTVPWGERSDWSELTISTDDVRPMTILEIEWIGQVQTRGRRV